MAKIDIERPHSMGTTRVRAVIDDFAASLQEQFGLTNHWQGDVLQFSGNGVTGAITKEAEAQGLTPETLKQATSEAGRKVQNVVAHSAEQIRSGPT